MAVTVVDYVYANLDGLSAASSLTSGSLAGTGTDRAILALGGVAHGPDPFDINGCTWDVGTPQDMTELFDSGVISTFYIVKAFGLAGQDSATDTVTISFDDDNLNAFYVIITLEGVDQDTPFGTVQMDANFEESDTTLTFTESGDDDRICDVCLGVSATAMSEGADQTEHESPISVTFGGYRYSGSHQAGSVSGDVMTWSLDDEITSIALGVNVNAAGGGGGVSIPVLMNHYRQQHRIR